MTLKDLPPISPSAFFHTAFHIPHRDKRKAKQNFLPDTSTLLSEEAFAKVALYWHEMGLSVQLEVKKALEEVFFPDVTSGDGIELFIDTRDLKTANSVTRFCHHFVFLPEEIDGASGQEVTRFRSDDAHDLADPHLFVIDTTVKSRQYSMKIEIPKEALYGYDPHEFSRLGFTYRINRFKGEPQHFALSSHFFALEKHPELWATLLLDQQ